MHKIKFTPTPAEQTPQRNFPDLILVLGVSYLENITFIFLTLVFPFFSLVFFPVHQESQQQWPNHRRITVPKDMRLGTKEEMAENILLMKATCNIYWLAVTVTDSNFLFCIAVHGFRNLVNTFFDFQFSHSPPHDKTWHSIKSLLWIYKSMVCICPRYCK